MLFNLLSNAIGFSSSGQTVRLKAERKGNEIVFTVADEGRGIPEELKERVFDRFESHTAGARHRGLGLGLSIVRSFVELHGGRVWLDSTPGRGTIVTCVFPDAAIAARAGELIMQDVNVPQLPRAGEQIAPSESFTWTSWP